MEISVCIGTYGADEWFQLARERAAPSVPPGVPLLHSHAESLTAARNRALARVETEWVVHLDADDELSPGYLEAMSRGTADVRGPMALYIRSGRERLWQPRVAGHLHNCSAECLREGNWLLIGAAVRTELIRAAGGWRDFPWSEDWDVWLRCWKLGASFELIREAIYRAHVRPDSRNRGATREAKLAAHEAIHRANFPVAA